jgi:hypothetical protein
LKKIKTIKNIKMYLAPAFEDSGTGLLSAFSVGQASSSMLGSRLGTGSPYAPKMALGSTGTVPIGPHSVLTGALLPTGYFDLEITV